MCVCVSDVYTLDSRMLGNDVKLRPNSDLEVDRVVIPDPTQSVMSQEGALIQAWQMYVNTVSIRHYVQLQAS